MTMDMTERSDASSASAGASIDMPLADIWQRVFEDVRLNIHVPTVWLAMQQVQPLAIDGPYFVVSISKSMSYLSINLEDSQSQQAIEDGLRKVVGYPLSFQLIEGESLEDWERVKPSLESKRLITPSHATRVTAPAPIPQPVAIPAAPQPQNVAVTAVTSSADAYRLEMPGSSGVRPGPISGQGFSTWELLGEWMTLSYKQAPLAKYPHGQARYLLESVQRISATMDILMPAPGMPSDPMQERHLARAIDRVAASLNVDSFFVSLELMRYRQLIGLNIGIP